MDAKLTLKSVLPDILSFAIGLAIAYFMQWEVRDIVWSLWLSSLCIGYLTLLIAISAFAYGWVKHAKRKNSKEAANSKPLGSIFIAFLLGGLIFMASFTVHFGGFHLIHSVFLNAFFPIAGLEIDLLDYVFNEPSKIFSIFYFSIFLPYGLFLIPAILTERHHLLVPIKTLKEKLKALNKIDMDQEEAIKSKKNILVEIQKMIGRPYKNVIRMHLLIFFFAFCHVLKLDAFIIFAVVYAVYFFPWKILRKQRTQISQN